MQVNLRILLISKYFLSFEEFSGKKCIFQKNYLEDIVCKSNFAVVKLLSWHVKIDFFFIHNKGQYRVGKGEQTFAALEVFI